jgi:PAS domain S-box-containing protein
MKILSDSVLENLKSMIVVLDENGNLEYISSSVKNVLGFIPEQLIGDYWVDYSLGNQLELRAIRSIIAKKNPDNNLNNSYVYEQQLKTVYGNDKWILWTASKQDGNKLVAIGQDISDRKKAEIQLSRKNKELFNMNSEIKQSLEYASRLQAAILPDIKAFKSCFNDAFVLYQPKDIIGGDYYFIYENKNKIFVAVVDCTGHGVPGALMSVMANSILKDVIINQKIEEPSEILYQLDVELQLILNSQVGHETKYDGMDVSIGVFDLAQNKIFYSGAFRPMILIRDNEVIEFKPNRYPIGFYIDIQKEFITQTFNLRAGDSFYLFTDGYCDQFGGEKLKKFNRKRFKELLLFIQSMEMYEQESFLSYAFNNWRQNEPQMDDILILGLKI